MDPELALSELLIAVRALKAAKRNGKKKISKLRTQVESLKAEIETLNRRLAEVTTSEQKTVQVKLKTKYRNEKTIHADLQRKYEELAQINEELAVALKRSSRFLVIISIAAGLIFMFLQPHTGLQRELKEKNKKLKIALNKMPAHRADLQRQCEELTERNKELTIALKKKPVPHADLPRQCEELAEKNEELSIALKKKPAPPPSGPSAAKWKVRCEKLKEEYLALQLCYQELKTEFHDLDDTYRGFVFADFGSMQNIGRRY
ncbi:hypothetical protein C8J57DRAFT_1240489 [Mycena rebaudengoi]|nr:hypothetical protein C8J57DRAFT_1240489 [Mycena rebaudengoi]